MTMNDEPWWEHMFSPQERHQLELVTNKMEHEEPIPLEAGCIQVDIEISADMIGPLLRAVRDLQANTDDDIAWDFLQQLGEEIAIEYLEGDLEFDEPTVDVAQWFLPES